MNKRYILSLIALGIMMTVVAGCAEKVFVPKPAQAPAIVHCFDTVGHQPGAKPWALGGPCCCTPAPAVLADWQAHGYFTGQSVDDVVAIYHQKGIKLATDHHDCNNVCPDGPHVVKGGHCMVPPTPGTENYEEVLFGQAYVSKSAARQNFQDSLPSRESAYTVAPKTVTK